MTTNMTARSEKTLLRSTIQFQDNVTQYLRKVARNVLFWKYSNKCGKAYLDVSPEMISFCFMLEFRKTMQQNMS